MAWRAEELGLCKEDTCWYYRNLNPYKKQNFDGINLNELLNQSYLFSGIEAYAWNDIAWLSKSTFLAYGNKKIIWLALLHMKYLILFLMIILIDLQKFPIK